ncbi:hypothetical protein B7P33_17115 [Sediminicola luteus]|uniref:Uncharacterized protein n=2 Tax=Sediminicola luteus TaxID=319238 RepID=A0A2A4G4T4_9FLAO|nr:hypothetical protein B7P33_17115 [Sediminicola luteus]
MIGLIGIPQNTKKNVEQEVYTIIGTYDGLDDGMYSFTYTNEFGDEDTIEFDAATTEVLESFDLDSTELLGDKFKVDYQENIGSDLDEDGGEMETIERTIVGLKLID